MEILRSILNRTLHGQEDSDAHLMTLFSLVINLKAKNVLELGVREGTTTFPLLTAILLTGGKLTSVDIMPAQNLFPNALGKEWNFVQSDAIKYLESVQNSEKFDLIFVD